MGDSMLTYLAEAQFAIKFINKTKAMLLR